MSQSNKLRHERDSGTRGRSHRPGTRPTCANRHSHGCQLVFGLHNGVGGFSRFRIDPISFHVIGKALPQAAGRCYGIPGQDRHSREHAAQRTSRIPINNDLALGFVHPLDPEGIALGQMIANILGTQMSCFEIEIDCFLLLLEPFGNCDFDLGHLDPQQLGGAAHIHDVGDQLTKAHVLDHFSGQTGKGNGIVNQIFSDLGQIELFVIDDDPARFQSLDVFFGRLRIHGDQDIDLFFSRVVAVLGGTDGKPSG